MIFLLQTLYHFFIFPLLALRSYINLPKQQRAFLKKIKSDSIIIDIGANVGIFALFNIFKNSTIICIEPNKRNLYRLKLTLLICRIFSNKTILVNKALVDDLYTKRTVKLSLPKKCKTFLKTDQGAFIDDIKISNNLYSQYKDIYVDVIKVKKLDKIINNLNKNNSDVIIKIDIEGAEILIQDSLIKSNLLQKTKLAFIELHDKKYPHLKDKTLTFKSKLEEYSFDKNINICFNWH